MAAVDGDPEDPEQTKPKWPLQVSSGDADPEHIERLLECSPVLTSEPDIFCANCFGELDLHIYTVREEIIQYKRTRPRRRL